MPCACRLDDLEREFSPGTARRDRWRYRRFGPLPATRRLLKGIRAEGVRGRTLLDIGGGVGAIPHELFGDGLAGATAVDVSSSYLAASRGEAEERGHRERMSFLHGDFVEIAEALSPADIVTLDRVVCCYPDMERLVRSSADRAEVLYGLVHPREGRAMRLAVAALNLSFRLRRSTFRVYLHGREAIDALVRSRGFVRRYQASTALWRVDLYTRVSRPE